MVVVVIGPDGKPVAAPPEPSRPQRWLTKATNDNHLADALTYFARSGDWFDIYKALECLELKFGGESGLLERDWAPSSEIKRLKQNANYLRRHARLKFDPPAKPMALNEAQDLLATLIARAFDEASATPPAGP
jgi:hypothetical protein